jgi:hypothetical protein
MLEKGDADHCLNLLFEFKQCDKSFFDLLIIADLKGEIDLIQG